MFNFSSSTSRRDAYEWAQQRYNAWTPATADSSLNYAIFDIGPGTRMESEEAAAVVLLLSQAGAHTSGSTLEFIVIDNPSTFGFFMLAQVTGVNPAHRGNPLSYWRFEFIRPRNARERAQREQQREDRFEGLEVQEPFDIQERREAQARRMIALERQFRENLALERAMREDIRDNHQPNANNIAAPQQPQPRRLVDFDQLDQLDQFNQLDQHHVETTLARQQEADRQQQADLQQETDRLDRRAREMFRQRREAAEADQAENEIIVGDRVFRRARRDSRVSPPPRRRQLFAEQSLEPWAPTPEDNHLPNAGRDFWDEF